MKNNRQLTFDWLRREEIMCLSLDALGHRNIFECLWEVLEDYLMQKVWVSFPK